MSSLAVPAGVFRVPSYGTHSDSRSSPSSSRPQTPRSTASPFYRSAIDDRHSPAPSYRRSLGTVSIRDNADAIDHSPPNGVSRASSTAHTHFEPSSNSAPRSRPWVVWQGSAIASNTVYNTPGGERNHEMSTIGASNSDMPALPLPVIHRDSRAAVSSNAQAKLSLVMEPAVNLYKSLRARPAPEVQPQSDRVRRAGSSLSSLLCHKVRDSASQRAQDRAYKARFLIFFGTVLVLLAGVLVAYIYLTNTDTSLGPISDSQDPAS